MFVGRHSLCFDRIVTVYTADGVAFGEVFLYMERITCSNLGRSPLSESFISPP